MHCEVAFGAIVDGTHATDTELIVGAAAPCTVTDAVPDFVASCVLVAVTVTLPADDGAVRSPLVLTVPLLVDHFTVEL